MPTTDTMTEMFEHMTDTFAKTLKTGLKFQEESARFWTDMYDKNTHQCQTHYDKMVDSTAPLYKKNLDGLMKMFDHQAGKSLELLKESCELSTAASPVQFGERMAQLWRHSFDAFRESADMMARTNQEVFENWTKMAREAAPKTNGSKPAHKAAAR